LHTIRLVVCKVSVKGRFDNYVAWLDCVYFSESGSDSSESFSTSSMSDDPDSDNATFAVCMMVKEETKTYRDIVKKSHEADHAAVIHTSSMEHWDLTCDACQRHCQGLLRWLS